MISVRSLVTLVAALLVASPAAAAPIAPIVARLDPGQSGPVYSWSLRISVEGGYDVSAVTLLTSGYDSFTINPAIPFGEFAYVADPLLDGRNWLVVESLAADHRLVVGGQQDFLWEPFSVPTRRPQPSSSTERRGSAELCMPRRRTHRTPSR